MPSLPPRGDEAPPPPPRGEDAPAARAAEGESNNKVRGIGGAASVCGVCGTFECASLFLLGGVCGRGPGLAATALQLLAARPRDVPGEGGGTARGDAV